MTRDSGKPDVAHSLDPLDVAVHRTVHGFTDPKTGEKGAPALAKTIGMKPGVLQNKADPGMDEAQLNLKQARSVVLATGDTEIAEAFAAECGGVFVPVEKFNATGDAGLLEQYTAMEAEHGRLAGEIHAALDDKKLTPAHIRALKTTLNRLISEQQALVARMGAVAEPD